MMTQKQKYSIKFVCYSTFFTVLLFACQSTFFPSQPQNTVQNLTGEPLFGSGNEYASVSSGAVILQSASTGTQNSPKTTNAYNAAKALILARTQTKAPLLLAFNPNNVVHPPYESDIEEEAKTDIFKSRLAPIGITFDSTVSDPRGHFSEGSITISTQIDSTAEAIAVFTHEMGHDMDLNYLRNKLGSASTDAFYTISF